MHVFDFREPASAWTHLVGLVLAVVGVGWCWRLTRGRPGLRVSLMVYGASLVFCYAASTLFHGVRVGPEGLGFYRRLDGVGIFALIAGSYTAIAWNLLDGGWRVGTLGAVWGTGLLASAFIASGRPFPPEVGTAVYLGMGWGVLACYARIARVVSHRAMVPVVVGGVLYSVGAVLNVVGWPALWPGSFGVHDLFHLFVIGGSLAHYWFVVRVVVPFVSAARGAGGGVAAGRETSGP